MLNDKMVRSDCIVSKPFFSGFRFCCFQCYRYVDTSIKYFKADTILFFGRNYLCYNKRKKNEDLQRQELLRNTSIGSTGRLNFFLHVYACMYIKSLSVCW